LRISLDRQGYISTRTLSNAYHGKRVVLAGIVLIRQRPGSAKGVCFITLEDEVGVANLVVWPKVMEAYRATIMGARLIAVRGRVQRDGDIIHVVADHLEDRSDALNRLADTTMPTPIARADEVKRPVRSPHPRHPRNVRIIPKSRDFH
jgi:error-prone DNA polymerase